ncbi:MAG TPA: hypothetical protein VFC52_06055 [Solirubrobacterales bacterium]|nr:hypothetical protein [Solirubrobacterales bacterium]
MAEQAQELGGRVIVPACALAQVWRGGPRSARLARLLDSAGVDVLDEKRAKEVGVRLGSREADDVADAHVACCAIERRAAIVTSDRDDIEALIEPGERVGLIDI